MTLSNQVLVEARRALGLSGQVLEQRLGHESGWVSRLERGKLGARRDPDLIKLLDHLHGSTPSLHDLWRLADQPQFLPAHVLWRHHPDGPGPIWLWLRHIGPHAAFAHIRWGSPFQGDVMVPGGGGLILTFPLSIPNPPLETVLTAPGWALIGRGEPNASVLGRLGIQLVDARAVHQRHDPEHPVHRGTGAERWIRSLTPSLRLVRGFARDHDIAWKLVASHLGVLVESEPSAEDLKAEHNRRKPTAPEWKAQQTSEPARHRPIEDCLLVPEVAIRGMRTLSGLSRVDAAVAVTRLDPLHPVSHKAIENLEKSGSRPRAAGAIARLDTIYGFGGRLGVQKFCEVDGNAHLPAKVKFPTYWKGPVWLQVTSGFAPTPALGLTIQWGHWKRHVTCRVGDVLTTGRATRDAPDVLVTAASPFTVRAGTGLVPDAIDINHGWRPVTASAAIGLLLDNLARVRKGKWSSQLGDLGGQ